MSDARWLARAEQLDTREVTQNGSLFLIWNDGDEDHLIPAKYEVCDLCQGRGTHVNPNIDDRGISMEDFDRDPDFRESYFSGVYDVSCFACKGNRVVAVPDPERANSGILVRLETHRRELRQMYQEEEAERRMLYGPNY